MTKDSLRTEVPKRYWYFFRRRVAFDGIEGNHLIGTFGLSFLSKANFGGTVGLSEGNVWNTIVGGCKE